MVYSSQSATVLILPLLILLALVSSASGCTPMPPGQGRAVNFTVSGFNLPVAMAYSTMPAVQSAVPLIATSQAAAMALVRNLIMEAVTAVLEQEGRNALLPGFLISAILDQLTVTVNYTPLMCPMVYTTTAQQAGGMPGHCFVTDNIVTVICQMANCNAGAGTNVGPIPMEHLMITGGVMTTNLIMAGWPTRIWQSVFTRALQMVRQGSFGINFVGASVTVM